jgi:hypothetical protein
METPIKLTKTTNKKTASLMGSGINGNQSYLLLALWLCE